VKSVESVDSSFTPCERVGRDGLLALRFERRDNRTVLTQSRFKLPLQVLAPAVLDDGTLYLMLLNPTGGLVGGDRLLTRIVQGSGTGVCVTTPSATRVYRTASHPAIHETLIQVGEGASLEYLPDHIIPHAGSELRQSLRVEMARESRAIIWDALAAGRLARGERWDFRALESRTEILLCGRPLFINRTRINPLVQSPDRLGLMEGFSYAASLMIMADAFRAWEELVASIETQLKSMPQILGAVSLLAASGCLVRLFTHSAADLIRAQSKLWAQARELAFGLDPFDLRKY
jgi:urease accessory protein